MTRSRPTLVTVIVAYELITNGYLLLYALVYLAYVVQVYLTLLRTPGLHWPAALAQITPWQLVLDWLSMGLGVAAAIMFWRMRRVAFLLFGTRLSIAVVLLMTHLLGSENPLSSHSSVASSFWLNVSTLVFLYVPGILSVLLKAAIAWYCYRLLIGPIKRVTSEG